MDWLLDVKTSDHFHLSTNGNRASRTYDSTSSLENVLYIALFTGLHIAQSEGTHEVYVYVDLVFSQIFTRSESKTRKTSRWKKAMEEELAKLCNVWWISTDTTSFVKLCNSGSIALHRDFVTNN